MVGEHDGDFPGASGDIRRKLGKDLLGLLLGRRHIDAAAGYAGCFINRETGRDRRAQLVVGGKSRGCVGKLFLGIAR